MHVEGLTIVQSSEIKELLLDYRGGGEGNWIIDRESGELVSEILRIISYKPPTSPRATAVALQEESSAQRQTPARRSTPPPR